MRNRYSGQSADRPEMHHTRIFRTTYGLPTQGVAAPIRRPGPPAGHRANRLAIRQARRRVTRAGEPPARNETPVLSSRPG